MIHDSRSLTIIAEGFGFIEGPTWVSDRGVLLFDDIPAARTFEWSPTTGLSTVRVDNGKANGTTLDREGRLVSCEHLTNCVVRWEADGARTVLASHFEGRGLNSPNDVVVSSDGTVYFTDPPFGRTLDDMGRVRERELDFSGVYALTGAGSLHLLSARCSEPNGLCLNADESRLFVNDTATGEIIEFELKVGPDQGVPSVDGGRVWAVIPEDETGSVDGMKFDQAGNLYCTGPGGIHVLDKDARRLDVIGVPEKVGNFAWGDADRCTLYICASTTLYSIRTMTPGFDRGR